MIRFRIQRLKCKKCKRLQPHKKIRVGWKLAMLCLVCDTIRNIEITRKKEPVINPRVDL